MPDQTTIKDALREQATAIIIEYLMKLGGKNRAQLEEIYKAQISAVQKAASGNPEIDQNNINSVQGLVGELVKVEYKAFCDTKEGRNALKAGGIEKSWLEYLMGAGAVQIYNKFSAACGGIFKPVTLASEQFEQAKKEIKAELELPEKVTKEVTQFKENHKDPLYESVSDPVKEIVNNNELVKESKMHLLTEYANGLVKERNISILQDTSIENALTAVARHVADGPEKNKFNALLKACKDSPDIDRKSQVIKKTDSYADRAVNARNNTNTSSQGMSRFTF